MDMASRLSAARLERSSTSPGYDVHIMYRRDKVPRRVSVGKSIQALVKSSIENDKHP